MALITEFHETRSDRASLHPTTTQCGWRVFSVGRTRILQLDTYGSDDRELTGKVSQSLQFDEGTARALRAVIDRAFPN